MNQNLRYLDSLCDNFHVARTHPDRLDLTGVQLLAAARAKVPGIASPHIAAIFSQMFHTRIYYVNKILFNQDEQYFVVIHEE